METLSTLVSALDRFFELEHLAQDPTFCRHLPAVYQASGVAWQTQFEPDFVQRFNGLMLRGATHVETIYTAVFPSEDVLERFISQASPGDLLFSHHPLDMECGDPRGSWGRGFRPIPAHLLDALKSRDLSFYAMHSPLDYNCMISTNLAMARALDSRMLHRFLWREDKSIGLIAEIDPISFDSLIERLLAEFEIPYVDFEGNRPDRLQRVAIVAGCGDRVGYMQEAEAKGADAYISGEIHCHIDTEYGRRRYQEIIDYAAATPMGLIGVSHAASEEYVLKTDMARWFGDGFAVNVERLPPAQWWH